MGVRARNESAWLLPNDGTRTNHRLRRDMRRFADSDEIDLVMGQIGCPSLDQLGPDFLWREDRARNV